jgi:hypothetical protein
MTDPGSEPTPGTALEKHVPENSSVLTRDFLTFAGKLLLNASLEVFMMPLAALAYAVDMLTGRSGKRSQFYRVMRLGEYWDDWLNTFRPASEVEYEADSLKKSAVAGADQLIAKVETLIASGELPKRYRSQVAAWAKTVKRAEPGDESGPVDVTDHDTDVP